MGKASRDKGKRGEREFVLFCREQGYNCWRTGQYRGNTGAAADVEGLPGIHLEVKRTEALRPWDYMSQSAHDAALSGCLPVVAWKKSNCPWLILMQGEDWFELYRPFEQKQPLLIQEADATGSARCPRCARLFEPAHAARKPRFCEDCGVELRWEPC